MKKIEEELPWGNRDVSADWLVRGAIAAEGNNIEMITRCTAAAFSQLVETLFQRGAIDENNVRAITEAAVVERRR